MAPLILHNVPDDECYVGEDGVKRPYAMIMNSQDGHAPSTRPRRVVPETGSFGKSTRRSRSRTGTPARSRENPTIAAADKVFGEWLAGQVNTSASTASKSTSKAPPHDDAASLATPPQRSLATNPCEMILRGYKSVHQQYAAITHYEALAGCILEDYPRDPPIMQRRWMSELRDPAFTRRRPLSAEERAVVNRAAGGEHWIKVTFESQEAGDAARYASPQEILGHWVYAEKYNGLPPAKDEACPDAEAVMGGSLPRSRSVPVGELGSHKKRPSGNLPTSFSSRVLDLSASPAPESRASTQTVETGTLSSSHVSTTTVTDLHSLADAPATPGARSTGTSREPIPAEDSIFCRRIPTARRVRLLPAEQALLPQQSVMQRFVHAIPLVRWFSGSMIGDEVPRMETGEFDWNRASLYWKVIWWLDATFGLFKGDVCGVEKEE